MLFDRNKLSLRLILAVGIGLRLFHFFDNRSLWRDEARLALNLIDRNFQQLADFPLARNQHAPLGFLYIEKLFATIFGYNEMALRLFPLLCGIGSLLIFSKLALKLLSPQPAFLAVACLALAHPAIYQSVEVKQYATELLVSLLLCQIRFSFQEKKDIKTTWIWGLAGGILLWFSYSAVFVLAGLWLAGSKWKIGSGKLDRRIYTALIFHLFSFGLHYFFLISKSMASGEIVQTWQAFFLPFPPQSQTDFLWFFRTAFMALDEPLGLNLQIFQTSNYFARLSYLACLFFPAGIYVLWKTNKKLMKAFLFPLVLLLLASVLKKYPVYERFLLFYSPVVFLIVGFGVQYFFEKIQRTTISYSLKTLLSTLLILAFLLNPLVNSISQVIDKQRFGGFRRNQFAEALFCIETQEVWFFEKIYLDSSFSDLYDYYQKIDGLDWKVTEIQSDSLPEAIKKPTYLILYTPDEKKYWDETLRTKARDQTEKVQKTMKRREARLIFSGTDVQVYQYP